MPERLTPAQAADADSSALREVELHEGKEGCWARHPKRILDLLDENAALLARAEQAEAERDTLLDILERLHSVQDGCPLHKYNTVWVKAMEDAQAAFDRAGGGA